MQHFIVKGQDADGEEKYLGESPNWGDAQNIGQRAKLSGEVVNFRIVPVH